MKTGINRFTTTYKNGGVQIQENGVELFDTSKDKNSIQQTILKNIKNILVDLATQDQLPLDWNEFDQTLLEPAFKTK